MEDKRLEHLISEYLSGSLSEADAAELAALVRDSDEAGSTAARHLLMDRLMRGAGMEPVDAERVMRALGSRASNETADRVLDRLEHEAAPGDRSPSRRIPRLRTLQSQPTWWVSFIVAASILLLLTLFVSRDSSPRMTPKQGLGTASAPPEPKQTRQPVAPLVREEPRPVINDRKDPPLPQKDPERPAELPARTPDRPAEPQPKPRPEAPAPPTPPAKPATPTVVAQATTVEQAEGEVFVTARTTRSRAVAGEPIPEGYGVQTLGPQSRATIRFRDGTRVQLQADTDVREILEVLGARGKRFTVAAGTIEADVKEQPKDKHLVITAPHAEARVLGTTLKLIVDLSGKGSSRLEVKEGKVQFKRRADGRTVEVTGGTYAIASAGLELATRPLPRAPVKRADGLPYDASCPIVYTNDAAVEFLDDYLMALASAGDIDLRGIMTTTSVAPFNPFVTTDGVLQGLKQRDLGVRAARISGFTRIPQPIHGPLRHLERPASGRIEDTRPINSAGTQLILTEARLTTPDHPVVVIAGVSALTAIADAYLLDNSIVDRVVVCWSTGQPLLNLGDYGSWSDPWAAYIVIERFRTFIFPTLVPFQMSAAKLRELPDTEFRRWMMARTDPGHDMYPALSILRPDYVVRTQRMSFDRWVPNGMPSHDIPTLKDDPNGKVWFVTQVNGPAGEDEWWRAIKNPAAWGRKPK